MGNLDGFNADEVEPNSGFDPLPAGEYKVAIIDSIMCATKAGTGQYLQLELDVLDGKYAGRKLFDNLNLINPNEKAVEIARGTLSSICRAVGVLTPNDSSDLHGRALIAKVVVKHDEQYGDKNQIKSYKAVQKHASNPANAPSAASEQLRREIEEAANGPPDDEIPF